MVQREQSLADLLADGAGNLSPEVADLVSGAGPRRQARSRRRLPFLVVMSLAFLAGALIGASIQDNPHPRRDIRGRAEVFGYHVNVRQAPGLEAAVIRQANQGEVFGVVSFSDGWYQVSLGDHRTGHIFGAYLLPEDFQLKHHRVGVTEDGTKLLLASCQHQGWYRVILPDGKTRYIRKGDVRVAR